MKPLVSIFMSTIRPYNWPILHKNFSTSSVPFEMICVGPIEPDFAMPDNMKFIYSEVKPAQCVHIGVQAATGKYVMSVADDAQLCDGGLDRFVNEAEKCSDIEKTIMTPQFARHGQDFFGVGDESTPVLPVGMFLTKKLWDKYGVDKNFYGVYWDTDISMMNYADGGRTIICKDIQFSDALPIRAGTRVSSCYCSGSRSTADRSWFYAMWVNDFLNVSTLENDLNFLAFFDKTGSHYKPPPRGSWIRKERYRPFDPIVDSDDILTVSQGKNYE